MPTYPPLDVVPHWADVNEHLIDLASAVPSGKWNWSPEPRMWNFRGIFLHIVSARYFTANEQHVPDFWREGQTTEGLREHLRKSWDHVAERALTPGAMIHDVHHRADILHYLDILQVDLSSIPRPRPL